MPTSSTPPNSRKLWQGAAPREPVDDRGCIVKVPDGWALLPPGDAALTRRVKATGPAWVVQAKRGRRMFSQGVWAPAETVARLAAEREAEQSDPRYVQRLRSDRARRAQKEAAYVVEFARAVEAFLAFAPAHLQLARALAVAVAEHACLVGSGTVARTRRIDVSSRAEAATIAWMRHQTTAYDDMQIPRVKGLRREVRQLLATRSRKLLHRYRTGEQSPPSCPLRRALLSE